MSYAHSMWTIFTLNRKLNGEVFFPVEVHVSVAWFSLLSFSFCVYLSKTLFDVSFFSLLLALVFCWPVVISCRISMLTQWAQREIAHKKINQRNAASRPNKTPSSDELYVFMYMHAEHLFHISNAKWTQVKPTNTTQMHTNTSTVDKTQLNKYMFYVYIHTYI